MVARFVPCVELEAVGMVELAKELHLLPYFLLLGFVHFLDCYVLDRVPLTSLVND